MNNIWMYWESKGGAIPEHIKLCIETVNMHKGSINLHLLNQNNICDYLPDLRSEWHEIKHPAHKADYIRTRLVYAFGGLWLDCDMIILSNLQPLFDNFPDNYDYACQNIGTSIGCFLARKNCPLLKKIIDAQDKIIDKSSSISNWYGIGNELLKIHGKDYPYYRWEEWTLDEIPGGEISKLFSPHENIADNIAHNAVIFHLCNENAGPHLKIRLRPSRLTSSNTLLSQLFRRALGNEDMRARTTTLFIELLLNYNFAEYIKKNIHYYCSKIK